MRVRGIYVCGAGGTGSYAIPAIARLLTHHECGFEAEMVICDKDKFEPDNLARQMCPVADAMTGSNKAVVACEGIDDMIDCEPVEEYIRDGTDLHSYLFKQLALQEEEDEDISLTVFILTVDNDATRKVFYDVVHEKPFDKLDVAIIDPGNDMYTGQVGLWLRIGGKTPFCDPREVYEQLRSPKDRAPGDEGCQEEVKSSPQLITANMMAATLTVHTLYCLLDNQRLTDEVLFDLERRMSTATGEWAGEGRKLQGDGEPAKTVVREAMDEAYEEGVRAAEEGSDV